MISFMSRPGCLVVDSESLADASPRGFRLCALDSGTTKTKKKATLLGSLFLRHFRDFLYQKYSYILFNITLVVHISPQTSIS